MESHRCVTVVGAGGIGKSRLAQAVAHAGIGRWPDGVWIVELAGLTDPALLPHGIAQALGVNVPEREAGLTALIACARVATMLLVLDNCEHLLESVAAFVDRLLKAAPGVHVLATSQEPLRLEAEQQYRVDPLAVPRDASVPGARDFGALALFEACVRAVHRALRSAKARRCRWRSIVPAARRVAPGHRARRRPRSAAGTACRARSPAREVPAADRRRADGIATSPDLAGGDGLEPRAAQPTHSAPFSARLGCLAGASRWSWRRRCAPTKSRTNGPCSSTLRRWWRSRWWWPIPANRSAIACSNRRAPSRSSSSPPPARPPHCCRRHAVAMLTFLQRADDGNMDSTLNTGEYAALVLPSWTTCAMPTLGPQATSASVRSRLAWRRTPVR